MLLSPPASGTGRLLHAPSPDLATHLATFGEMPDVPQRSGRHPGSLVDDIEVAGLRGRGGGWFPTHVKIRAVVESSAEQGILSRRRHPVVIANGMEGEPVSGKDAVLMSRAPHLVLDGIEAVARTIGATDAFIAIHRGSPVIDAMERAVAERSPSAFPITVVTPPARYVASEESALSHWVGDGQALPVFADRPFQRGAADRPTLVQNVETLAHIALIARYGGSWFAGIGSPVAPGTTLVTMAGAVAHPGVIEVPTGTPVRDLIARVGGTIGSPTAVLTGGYGGAWVTMSALESALWEPDSVRAVGGVIGASLMWITSEDSCPLVELDRIVAWMAGESAGQCGPCMFGLPALAADVHLLAGADIASVDRVRSRMDLIAGRGGCKHPDGVTRLVASALTAFPHEVEHHLRGRCSVDHSHELPAHALPPTSAPRIAELDPERKDFR